MMPAPNTSEPQALVRKLPAPRQSQPTRFFQFKIGTILLLMTIVAATLAVGRYFWPALFLLPVWLLPAFGHWYVSCRVLRDRVPPLDFNEKSHLFCISLGVTVGAWIGGVAVGGIVAPFVLGAGVLLGIDHAPGQVRSLLSVVGAIAIVAAGIAGAVWAMWITLPEREREQG